MAKRRRQRWGVLLASLVVIGAGLAIVLVFFGGDDEPDPLASAGPTASAAPETITTPEKEPVACDADVPKSAGSEKDQYAEPEDQKLDADKTYIWTLETSCGDIEITLDVENSPKTSNSVVFLTREKFYDGILFHRISPSVSVLQAGDPQGSGVGGPGYDVVEPPDEKTKYSRGVVAMAKGGQDPAGSSGSQFFIVFGDEAEALPPDYAVLGEVTGGEDTVDEMAKLANPSETPEEFVYIERATITEE